MARSSAGPCAYCLPAGAAPARPMRDVPSTRLRKRQVASRVGAFGQSRAQERKDSHPWINDRCENAIRAKNESEGSSSFDAKRWQCTMILAEEHRKYIQNLKERMMALPKSDKLWFPLVSYRFSYVKYLAQAGPVLWLIAATFMTTTSKYVETLLSW